MVKRLKTDSRSDTTQEPHDAFFRQLLAQPAMAAEFIQNYLPADVVSLLDLTQLQPEKDTFVDARLRKHFSDLLYSAPLKSGGKVFVYLIFEHKSQPDKQARLQLLRYMVRIWEQEWRKKRQLSPIVPILFYHGQEKLGLFRRICRPDRAAGGVEAVHTALPPPVDRFVQLFR